MVLYYIMKILKENKPCVYICHGKGEQCFPWKENSVSFCFWGFFVGFFFGGGVGNLRKQVLFLCQITQDKLTEHIVLLQARIVMLKRKFAQISFNICWHFSLNLFPGVNCPSIKDCHRPYNLWSKTIQDLIWGFSEEYFMNNNNNRVSKERLLRKINKGKTNFPVSDDRWIKKIFIGNFNQMKIDR